MHLTVLLLATVAGAADLGSLRDALAAQRYQDAQRIAEALIAKRPRDPFLWTAKGLAVDGQKRPLEAITAFERALRLNPAFIPALKAASGTAYRARDPRSTRFLSELLKLEPRNEVAHAMSAVLAFEAKRCDEALRHFEMAGAAVGADEVALAQQGYCLMTLGRAADAAGLYRELMRRRPESRNMRYNLALALHQARQNSDALAVLETIHDDPEALNLRAGIEAAEGRTQQAIINLREAARLQPADERNYIDLAALCVEHDNGALALDVLSTGLSNAPKSAKLYSVRGIVRVLQGDYEGSAADFETAAALMPEEPYAAVGMSVLLRQQNRTNTMVSVLRDRLRQSPSDWMLNYLLAEALVREGAEPGQDAFNEAQRALRKTVAAKPDFSRAHATLGKLTFREGQFATALNHLRKAVVLDPTNRAALNQLLLCLKRQNLQAEAAQVSAQLARLLQEELRKDVQKQRVRLAKVE